MLKKLILIAMLPLLASCSLTPQGGIIKAIATEKAKEISSDLLNDAVWWICRASPVGPVEDRFGTSKDLADARRLMCKNGANVEVIGPVRLGE